MFPLLTSPINVMLVCIHNKAIDLLTIATVLQIYYHSYAELSF